MFWIICAALVAVVAIAIVAPLMRGRSHVAEPAAAFDLRIYRDQLREVERDLERGVIDAGDAERLRIEIGRKVLAAMEQLGRGRGRPLRQIAHLGQRDRKPATHGIAGDPAAVDAATDDEKIDYRTLCR